MGTRVVQPDQHMWVLINAVQVALCSKRIVHWSVGVGWLGVGLVGVGCVGREGRIPPGRPGALGSHP